MKFYHRRKRSNTPLPGVLLLLAHRSMQKTRDGVEEVLQRRAFRCLDIDLGWHAGLQVGPVIRELQRVSKPGRRVYSGVGDLPSVRNGLGVAIVSTPKGVMSDQQARTDNVGGEVLCTVF